MRCEIVIWIVIENQIRWESMVSLHEITFVVSLNCNCNTFALYSAFRNASLEIQQRFLETTKLQGVKEFYMSFYYEDIHIFVSNYFWNEFIFIWLLACKCIYTHYTLGWYYRLKLANCIEIYLFKMLAEAVFIRIGWVTLVLCCAEMWQLRQNAPKSY